VWLTSFVQGTHGWVEHLHQYQCCAVTYFGVDCNFSSSSRNLPGTGCQFWNRLLPNARVLSGTRLKVTVPKRGRTWTWANVLNINKTWPRWTLTFIPMLCNYLLGWIETSGLHWTESAFWNQMWSWPLVSSMVLSGTRPKVQFQSGLEPHWVVLCLFMGTTGSNSLKHLKESTWFFEKRKFNLGY